MTNDANIHGKSRREFVKQSSMIAGSLLAAPLLSRANFFSGSDDTIKIALIGCGGRGTGAATQALSTKQNLKLVAMADAFKDRLDGAYKELTSGENFDAKKVDVPEDRNLVKGIYPIPLKAGNIRVKITDLLSETLEQTVKNG